ncbi:Phage P22-like portal protein [uncultured Caudovirales phage]|uniref:Phage P22-like portal protein n=1 Tax=uncultured Caudovirales phage TaxID=2100421 RepID=A0A6J5PSR0_9CAUD|nr:Phage P22-like portal protein [uncultured Caudovirales phage]CAB4200594.1 Phage P22-like portal protein [uncultured Caudovirales phage]CAB5228917.1 Phage P22-like portal protein [uncultured Caudovirales phage]
MSKEEPNKDLLETARSRMRIAIAAYSESREDELDDLRFAAGSPDNQWQWPADVLATRGSVQGQTINARPCLTINKLPQHIKQVTNDQRQNRPAGKVIPADDKADIEVAEIFDGIVRHIEYISDADVAYDTACENQVMYGEGYIRVLTEYCDENSFDQDIRIGRIRNSFSVYMDPTIQDPCGSDAQWCFITHEMLTEEFERQFPNANPISTLQSQGVGDQSMSQWVSDNTVRIAEYFYIEHKADTLNMYPGGATAFAGSPEAKQLEAMGMPVAKTRKVDRQTVKWCKINGYEVLEERDWAGKYIPVVRVVGNEFEVDGRLFVSGLVRNAKDAQRMYNYWVSQEAEMLALAPKAPFIGYGGQFEGYESQWKTANVNNWPYLEVNPDATDGQGGALPLPQRAQPPMASSGLLQAKAGASDDIKATTGQYDSSLGATSNERSGKAIMARERQTDTGTYHYVDNLARAVRYVTRQIVDLIPKIYDTQRIARIIGEDGETDSAKINPQQQEPVKKIVDQSGIVIEKIYNPSVGKYDVCVTTGPSYMTKRQEALEAMGNLLQGNPDLWKVAGDLFVKNMDWPGAQEMAKRFAKTIDPKLLEDGEDPAIQAANQQIQAMGQEMEQMHTMLQNVSKSMEAQELKIKAYDAETKRISVTQAGMSPEQIQEIIMGTVHGMITSGDLIGEMPGREMPPMQEQMPQEQMPQGMPPGGMQ